MSLREKFLKKSTDKKDDKDKKDKTTTKRGKKDRRIIEEDEDEDEDADGDWVKVDRGAVDKPKMFEKDTEITIELVVKKLREIMAARGKKRTNRKEQIGKTFTFINCYVSRSSHDFWPIFFIIQYATRIELTNFTFQEIDILLIT